MHQFILHAELLYLIANICLMCAEFRNIVTSQRLLVQFCQVFVVAIYTFCGQIFYSGEYTLAIVSTRTKAVLAFLKRPFTEISSQLDHSRGGLSLRALKIGLPLTTFYEILFHFCHHGFSQRVLETSIILSRDLSNSQNLVSRFTNNTVLIIQNYGQIKNSQNGVANFVQSVHSVLILLFTRSSNIGATSFRFAYRIN